MSNPTRPCLRLAGLIIGALAVSPAAWADPVPDSPASTEAEIAALRREVEAQRSLLESVTVNDGSIEKEPTVRLYGFADMGINKLIVPAGSEANIVLPSRATSFVLGNLNLYLDAQPSPDWSAMVEVRLTNYPNGTGFAAFPGQPGSIADTEVADVNSTNPFTKVKWSGIVLERAYLQWTKSDLLQLRMGMFLTPFGIWNIDHGTPTLISLMLPQFEVTELFPTKQLGLEALGRTQVGSWRLGYFAYVSNGRMSGQLDPSEDKMLGGRVTASQVGNWRLTFGASGFWGRHLITQRKVTAFDPIDVTTTKKVAFEESGVGADVSLDRGPLRLRAEFAHRKVVYQSGRRAPAWIPGAVAADNLETSGYVLGAYRLPWAGLEPYVYFEPYRWPTVLGEGMLFASVGLNMYFGAVAQLKFQYARQWFLERWQGLEMANPQKGAHFLLMRAVVAF